MKERWKKPWLTKLIIYCAGSDLQSLVNNIVTANYRPIPTQYSPVLSELVKVMLRPDPSRRPSSEQVSAEEVGPRHVAGVAERLLTFIQVLGATVLSQDVLNYMQYIRSLPDVMESGRKRSTGSVSSLGGAAGGADGGGGGTRGSSSSSSGQFDTLV